MCQHVLKKQIPKNPTADSLPNQGHPHTQQCIVQKKQANNSLFTAWVFERQQYLAIYLPVIQDLSHLAAMSLLTH